ncbi:MAG: beta-galactosidase [Clostridiales bacterium]|nr:beta-galactosidase [Clostridiales bacterium]
MKKQELLFGSAYYLEYMPYDRLKKDIAMMKAARMNVARIAESTWSTMEPTEGVFDFSYIDPVLDALEEENMMAIIGTPTYAVPAWLVAKDPTVLAETKQGTEAYGRRQNMDITNETYRYHAKLAIEALISHTAKRACVIGFQIDNETKHYGVYGERIQESFRAYLKEKYQTCEALNKAYGLSYWSNSIHRWEDFPDMKGCINGGLSSEFEKFQRSIAAQFLFWQADLVRKYKREDQFITHNFDFEWRKFGADIAQDGHSYGVQPDIDHAEAAKCLTLSGTDIYHPTQDDLTGAEIAFCGDEIRSLKQDNYLVVETQAQAFKYWTPYKGQLRLQAFSHLASGALGVMYWNWHSIHNGFETYWKGVLSHDLDTNPTYEEAVTIGTDFANLSMDTLAIKKENKIAIVVDNHTLTSYKWFPIDRELSYNDVVRWMYDALYEMNLECDIVHADELKTENYDMLITPALYSVSEELVQKLNAFVKRGGVLISSFKSFVADRNLSVFHDKQPHGMTECFGMSYNQFVEPGRTTLQGKAVRYFAELLKTKEATALFQYEHKYWGEYAGITEHAYGKGMAYYIGGYVEKETLKEIYQRACEAAGIKVVHDAVWPVIVRSGKNAAGKDVHYILHYSEKAGSFSSPYKSAVDLLSKKQYKQGEIIPLRDWEVVILEEM